MSSLVNHSVTNLINGVSQQATSVRLDNQLEAQVNCFSDVTKGLTIRNGFELQNVVSTDLAGRHPIEFTVDGTKYLVAIDAYAATKAVHIPMTADVEALTASLTAEEYFKDIISADLRVVENKDYVYILNKKKVVGTNNLVQAFYDIKITNDVTGTTDANWSTGSYTITITSEPDPAMGTVDTTTSNFLVSSTLAPHQVAAVINADTALTAETGVCYATGTKSDYRLTFEAVPEKYIAPTVSVTETVTITGALGAIYKEPSSGFYFDNSNYVKYNWQKKRYEYVWGGIIVGTWPQSAMTDVLKLGNITYYRGVYSDYADRYHIRREIPTTITANYTPSVTVPNTVSGIEYTDDKFSDKGMVWVTGVAANQEYNLRINYHDPTVIPTEPLTQAILTINPSTTTANIRLNWVAGQIQSKVNSFTHFSATQHGNAVYIYASTPYKYVIDSIEVDNSFDTTSLRSAVRASVNNASGIQAIDDLPPVFVEGFKIRVGNEDIKGANYYLRYDVDFQGWKECGLDESRVLDGSTMPYIIDKNEVRRDNVINIKPTTWERVRSGDEESNPYPTFVERTINDIFFYGSRLGVATDDSIILSAIDKPTVFFRTTCSKTITSDRVDIKLDSSKTGFNSIKDVVTYDGKLLLNTGTVQSQLLVNTSFDLSSARLSEVSSYTLGDKRPLPVENGLYFALYNNGFTNIYNYQASGGNTYQSVNVTRHVPTYIEGHIKQMSYAANFTVCSVEEDSKVLYVQNRYTENGEVLQNAWHKWTLPYDLEHFYFEDNNLYLLFSAEDSVATTYTLVTKYDLTPQVVTESDKDAYIGWIPYLDCWTKDKTLIENFPEFIGINDKYGEPYDTVTEAYDSTEVTQINTGTVDGPYFDESSPEYYWEVDGDTINLVWNGVPVVTVGNSTQIEFDYSGYRYYRGDLLGTNRYGVSRATTTSETYYLDNMVYGISFPVTVTFSEIIPRQQTPSGFVVMNYANLLLRRMRLLLSKSGFFTVTIDFADRNDYSAKYSGQPLGRALLGRNSVSDINFNFPINGKSDKVNITITSDTSTPFNLLSAEWQGQLTVKGRNI